MSIRVRYFASLKDLVGRSEDELQASAAMSVQSVWLQLHPKLAWPDAALTAINMEYVPADALVQDGDELAFFPPVTGG